MVKCAITAARSADLTAAQIRNVSGFECFLHGCPDRFAPLKKQCRRNNRRGPLKTCGFLRIIRGFVTFGECRNAVIGVGLEMSKIMQLDDDEADGWEDQDFKALSAQEAQALRMAQPQFSPWRVLGWQVLVGMLVALVAWGVTQDLRMFWSAGYGALAVVVPAALFTRGLFRRRKVPGAGAVLAGFFVWEMVKVVLTMAMLFVAPRLVPQLDWLALLAGFVVTMKAFWVTLWLRTRRQSFVKKID